MTGRRHDSVDQAGWLHSDIYAALGGGQPVSMRKHPLLRTCAQRKVYILALILLAIIAVGAGFAYRHLNTSRIAAMGALVFQSSGKNDLSTLTIERADGSKIRTITSDSNAATYYETLPAVSSPDYETGLRPQASALLTASAAGTSFKIITPDGKTRSASSALSSMPNFYTAITNSPSTLAGLIYQDAYPFYPQSLVRVDLTSGKMHTLLTFTQSVSLVPVGYDPSRLNVQLSKTSRDGRTAYLLVDGVTVNGTVVKSMSLLTLNLTSGTFTVAALPAQILSTMLATVSGDGKFVAYEALTANGLVTHIYTLAIAHDAVVPGDPVDIHFLPDVGAGLAFSPDDSYLAETANTEGISGGDELRIVSVTSLKIVQRLNGDMQDIVGYDWMGSHSFIYTTRPYDGGDAGGNVNSMTAHSMDVITGKIFNFPQSGKLIGTLSDT